MKKAFDLLWILVLLFVSFLMLSPYTNKTYVSLVGSHPYIMGFIKFAILATMGELLSLRMVTKTWVLKRVQIPKMFVWGVLGVIITFCFTLIPTGVSGMIEKGLLFGLSGVLGTLLFAVYNSFLMNFTIGPLFMAAHRVSDEYIDHLAKKGIQNLKMYSTMSTGEGSLIL